MDDRGRLAQPLKGIVRWRRLAADRAALRAVRGAGGAVTHETEVPFQPAHGPVVVARSTRAGRAASAPPAPSPSFSRASPTAPSRAIMSRPSSRRSRTRATPPPMPPASASCRSRWPASITSAARTFSPPPVSPARRRCSFSTSSRRASGSRPIPGSPTPPCSSSIPASCRSASRSARRSRSGRRTGGCRSSPTTAPCSNPMSAPRLIELPLVVGRGAETRAKEFLALLDRYPDLRDLGARHGPGRRAALEPAAEERHRRAAAGNRHRARARAAGRARPGQEPDLARHRRHRSPARPIA